MTAALAPAWDAPAAEPPAVHVRLPLVPDWATLADPTGIRWEPDGTGRYWQLRRDGSRSGATARLGYLLDVHRDLTVVASTAAGGASS